MSQELLYTSAPTGLKSGSRGFATVLCTAGMASNIATRLETLSGYRHVFAPQDPQASLNPVSWSHVRMTINGQPTSILSRIAAYGVDYSGRTNKLAHHVVPSPAELAKAGPAWMLLQSSWVRTDWDGRCQTPASGPALPSGDQPVVICQRWQQTTGDAGWGGVLAEMISSPGSKPLWIVFSIDQSAVLLDLINESIALLPVSQRWRATFSTYCTNLPPEIDCKIRCVLVGTEEAKLAPARGTVIDLTKTLATPPSSAYVETARTGVAAKAMVPMPVSLGGTLSSPASPPLEAINSDDLWPDELVMQPPNVLGKSPALATRPSLPPQLPSGALNSGGEEGRRRRIRWAIGVSALAIILLLLAAVPFVFIIKERADEITELAESGKVAEQDRRGQSEEVQNRIIYDGVSAMPEADPPDLIGAPAVPVESSEALNPPEENSHSLPSDEPKVAATSGTADPLGGDKTTVTDAAEGSGETPGPEPSSITVGDIAASGQATVADVKNDETNNTGDTANSNLNKSTPESLDSGVKKTNLAKIFVVNGSIDVNAVFKKKSLQATFSFEPEADNLAFWQVGSQANAANPIDSYLAFDKPHQIQTNLGRVQLTLKASNEGSSITGLVTFSDFTSNDHFASYLKWHNSMELLKKDFVKIVSDYSQSYISYSYPRKNPGKLMAPSKDFFTRFGDAVKTAESLKADVNKLISTPPKSINPSHHDEFNTLASGFIGITDSFLTSANSGVSKQCAKLISETPELDIGEIVLSTNLQLAKKLPGTKIVLKLKLTVKE